VTGDKKTCAVAQQSVNGRPITTAHDFQALIGAGVVPASLDWEDIVEPDPGRHNLVRAHRHSRR